MIFRIFIFCLFVVLIQSETNFKDSRCRCICPSTAYFVKDNATNADNRRRFYTKTDINPAVCHPQTVVKPEVLDAVDSSHVDAFLANCDCKYESRNSVMLKVVVLFIIAVIFVLVTYMTYLTCVEPVIKRKRLQTPYRHQTDDMEDNIFARASATNSDSISPDSPQVGTTRSRNSVPNVLDRVEAEQNRWMKKVEVQRRNIFEDHTMLN